MQTRQGWAMAEQAKQLGRAAVIVAVAVVAVTYGRAATEVGRFAFVQQEVNSLKPGATDPIAAKVGDTIVMGEEESTGAASGAKLLFGEGGVITLGANTRFEVSSQAVDQATGRNVSTFSLLVGKARVFLSRFWSGRPEVKVDQPTAVVGIKGTEVGVEQYRDGRLTITCYGGNAAVRTKQASPQEFELSRGMQLKLDANGTPVGPPATLAAAELEALRSGLDLIADGAGESGARAEKGSVAAPSPNDIAASFGGLGATVGRVAIHAGTNGAAGAAWADPATSLLPSPAETDCNCTSPNPR